MGNQLCFRYMFLNGTGNFKANAMYRPGGYPQQVQPDIEFSKHDGMIETGQDEMHLIDDLIDLMLWFVPQTGDDHHEVTQGSPVFILRGRTLPQWLRGILKQYRDAWRFHCHTRTGSLSDSGED